MFKYNLKEIRGVGITYREGRAIADGKIPFPISLDPPLSVFTGHF